MWTQISYNFFLEYKQTPVPEALLIWSTNDTVLGTTAVVGTNNSLTLQYSMVIRTN